MSGESVREYLKQWKKDDSIIEMEESTATVQMAADALGTLPAHIAKTLSFYDKNGALLIVAAGDSKIDNQKFKEKFGFKAKMLSSEDVKALTGHEIGGVCPFDTPEKVCVYLDISLKRFETVFPACGSSNSAIKLTVCELETYSHFTEWVDVCKGWE